MNNGEPNAYASKNIKYSKAKLPGHFKSKPRLNTFISKIAYLLSQNVGNIDIDLRIDYATGYSLDILGSFLKIERKNRDDDNYKQAIKQKIQLITNNDISQPSVSQSLKMLFNCKQVFFKYIGNNILLCYMSINEGQTFTDNDVEILKSAVVPAGITFVLNYTNFDIIQTITKSGTVDYGIPLRREDNQTIQNEILEDICVDSFTQIIIT